MFTKISLTKSDISFKKRDQYTFLRLKQSKTNIKFIKMQRILIAIGKHKCLIVVLKKIFI